MKKLLVAMFAASAAAASGVAPAPADVLPKAEWPEVKPEALPGTRWWWMGSAVDSLNIEWALDQYHQAGIGSVEITPLYGVQGNDANDIPFLSDKWMEMLGDVQQAAARNSILVDMNQGTGWPFGGPEVDIEDAACKVVFLVDTVAPGAAPEKVLDPREQHYAKPIAENRRTLADGNEEVIRAFQSRTRQAVKRAAPGGEGLVIDHFDKGAVSRYLSKFDKAFSSSGVPYPHNFFNDSYEVYGANWTPTLFEEFEARRGYPLQDHLAELLGLVDDGNKALVDYRETLAELLLENFTNQWADWAHARGVQVRNQAHGSPANLIDVYAAVDVPEIEGFGLSDFGIKGLRTDPGKTRPNDSDVSMLKYASSAAHITGKPLTSSETFTWLTEHFRTSLSQMKPDFDLMMTCGVNHIFFHGSAYSPKDDPWPGWKFYASVDMSPTNTIWRDAPAFMDYITRSQSFTQAGSPDNDFLVYLPLRDSWQQRLAPGEKGLLMTFAIHDMSKKAPDFIRDILQIDSLGYDTDYISDKFLLKTTYSGGRILTDGGASYSALIIPGSGNLAADVKAHVDSLAALGAPVIYGVDAEAMAAVAKPEQMRRDLHLRALRRADADGHHYFIANLTPGDIDASVPLAVDFVDAVWFDPMTGDIYRAETDGGKVRIDLRSGQSRVLRVYDHRVDAPGKAPRGPDTDRIDLTDGKWRVSFLPAWDRPELPLKKTHKMSKVLPWTALGDPDLEDYIGTGIYTTTFKMDKKDLDRNWRLELGDVRESARVYLNDEYVGTAWSAPFTLDLGKALRKGKNVLRIEVTNLPANRIRALDRDGVQWRKFKEINVVDINYKRTTYDVWDTAISGLNSAVTLVAN